MTYPNYKILNEQERQEFTQALHEKIATSLCYPWLYQHIKTSITGFKIYFFSCFILLILCTSIDLSFFTIALLGFLSTQVLFALFHMRIHALFLEYDQ